MKIVKAGYEILTDISNGGIKELQHIERIARTCYKSEDRITEDGTSAKKMVASLINRQHLAMLEHSVLSIKFVCDRGVSHELVRHRIMSFAQESTRYWNYSKGQFGGEITVVEPLYLVPGTDAYRVWEKACKTAEIAYFDLLSIGLQPQQARAVLPNSLKTEITLTGNFREWRHFFALRACDATGPAHPQMHEIAIPCLAEVKERIPVVFDDLEAAK